MAMAEFWLRLSIACFAAGLGFAIFGVTVELPFVFAFVSAAAAGVIHRIDLMEGRKR